MSQLSGQATRPAGGHTARRFGRVAHALAQLAIAVIITMVVAVVALSWRLSRGPLDLPWLVAPLVRAINADQTAHVALGGAALAWEGFSNGVDQPIDIRLRDIVLTDAGGARIASIPRAEISLSPGRLLAGEIVPRAIEVDGARLLVVRAIDGTVTIDLGGGPARTGDARLEPTAPPVAAPGGRAASLLRQFVLPPQGDESSAPSTRWSQLRRVRIRDATITVDDQQLDTSWSLHGLGLDLARADAGGIVGDAHADLRVGPDVTAPLSVSASLDRTSGITSVAAKLGQLVPAALGRVVPAWAALAPLDAPVALAATLQLDPKLTPGRLTLDADIGAGFLHPAPGNDIAVLAGRVEIAGTLAAARVDIDRLVLAPRPGGNPTELRAQADVTRSPDGVVGLTGALDLDKVAFADLPALWPEGAGGPGARKWVTTNITAGTASRAHAEVALHIPADFSDVALTKLTGDIDGADLTVHWLRPVPPVEHVNAKLKLTGPDALSIAVTGGTQVGGGEGMRIQGGHVTITGLAAADQFADIDVDVATPVPDLLVLLRNRRLKLLDRSPMPISDATGQIAGRVSVTRLPLRDGITMADVAIRATAKATGLRIPGVAAGHDVDNGEATIEITPDGLRATGTATVAGLPAQARLDLDFRAGPKTQIVQKVMISATADSKQLAALGLDAPDLLTGSVGLNATLSVQRGGEGVAQIEADLNDAGLTVSALGFAKPPARPAKLTATVRLEAGNLREIAPIELRGDGARLDAGLSFTNDKPDLLTLRRAVLGSTTDVSGTVRFPRAPGDPWRAQLSGASLDLSRQFAHGGKPAKPAPEPPPKGPAYVVDARLDRVVMSRGRPVAGVVAHAENDGLVMRRLSVTGRTLMTGGGVKGGGATFRAAIAPDGRTRKLAASTADAGALLLALDIDDKIEGGRLAIDGAYDDDRPDHPLVGTATVEDFRVHDAPFLAKLLQAMTLYGLVEVARGPGLGFSRLVAPFRDDGDVLELTNARAFNASLGMTAKGSINLGTRVADLEGTIVPAYFFNSLLGDIPLIGRLFSPEKGGGLFAASYSVSGSLDDPSVSVNPLAALTPGFLRGVFGIFDNDQKSGSPPLPGPPPQQGR